MSEFIPFQLPDSIGPIRKKALELCLSPKPVEQLNDEEKFAICFAAGVAVKTSCIDGKFILETEGKCGIVLDGQYRVYVMENVK